MLSSTSMRIIPPGRSAPFASMRSLTYNEEHGLVAPKFETGSVHENGTKLYSYLLHKLFGPTRRKVGEVPLASNPARFYSLFESSQEENAFTRSDDARELWNMCQREAKKPRGACRDPERLAALLSVLRLGGVEAALSFSRKPVRQRKA